MFGSWEPISGKWFAGVSFLFSAHVFICFCYFEFLFIKEKACIEESVGFDLYLGID